MFNKRITLILMFIALVCIFIQPVSASDSLRQINVSVVSDLNQTAGKDIMSLVDTNRLDIGNRPVFDIIWSPDGSHMLIDAFVNAYPKGKLQLGGIDALYAANADGSGMTRIAWAERTSSSRGKIITPPLWSQSGDYFAYVELVTGSWHKIRSANLFVMSNDLNLIQKVELDPKMTDFLSNFKWSPKENKIAALAPGKIVIYDLDEKNNFSFSIPADYVEDMEWSPDGEKIVFLKNNHDIITLDIEKRKLNKIYSVEDIRIEHAGMYGEKWSPDGKKLIFYEIKCLSKNTDDVMYDVYLKDEAAEKPVKIITFNSGSSKVIQWYPDNERILLRKHSDDSYALYSLSISGKMKKLIEKERDIDGTVTSNGYILATSLNPSSRIPPYIRTHDLFLLNESDNILTIENVPYYTWKGTDLLFLKDHKISVLNTSTHDTWDIPLPLKNFDRFCLDPSGHFIAVDKIIFEINEQGTHIQTNVLNYSNSTAPEMGVIKKDMDEHSRENLTKNIRTNTFSFIVLSINDSYLFPLQRMKSVAWKECP